MNIARRRRGDERVPQCGGVIVMTPTGRGEYNIYISTATYIVDNVLRVCCVHFEQYNSLYHML